MTTHTAIADSEIDPESPGTTTLFTKLRDNPIATYEGNNPTKIVAAAMLDGFLTDTQVGFDANSVGIQSIFAASNLTSTTTVYAKAGDVIAYVPTGATLFNFKGVVKCPTSTADLRLYDDAPTVSTITANSNQANWTDTTTYQTFSVTAGTIMRLYFEFRRASGTGTATCGGLIGYFS